MNVLLVHHGDGESGGGQIQMNRLRRGLQRHGVEANILCKLKTREDSIAIPRRSRLESVLGKVTQRLGMNDIHCVSSFRLAEHEAVERADILDFHCLHSGFFSYLALPRLTAQKPAIFTFHDMWPITGHCHTSLECDRWKTGCGKCPYLGTYPPVRRDATAWEWKLKKRTYDRARFTIVAPSRWLCDATKHSMLGDFAIRHIPHGIDVDVFQPLDKEFCRALLGIPKGKNVLLFAVDNLTRRLKGGDLLSKVLEGLPAALKRKTLLLLFGRSGRAIAKAVDMETIDLGYVSNDRLKAVAYSAADVFLHPTRAEAFGLVLLESMACGTPTISFRVGGVPDLVREGATGLLAEPEDAEAFRSYIIRILEDEPLRTHMMQRCRKVVVEEYGLDLYIERYICLYQETIANAEIRSSQNAKHATPLGPRGTESGIADS